MTDLNFDERLKAMRARYLENFPEDEQKQIARLQAFEAMSSKEKAATIQQSLQLLYEKKELLSEKLSFVRNEEKKLELQSHFQQLAEKIAHYETKAAMLQLDETDSVKREKLKKQLAQLELKRIKFLLEKKDCDKIDRKIAEKKKFIKNFLQSKK